jgi:hypothetical protein
LEKHTRHETAQRRTGEHCGKLEDYVLNPEHVEGRHKARLFSSRLGITGANAQVLREALLNATAASDAAAAKGHNGFGVYALRTWVQTAVGAATILSAWIVLDGEDFPRLITCYMV